MQNISNFQEVVDVQGRTVVPVAKVDNKVVCRLNPTDLLSNQSCTKC